MSGIVNLYGQRQEGVSRVLSEMAARRERERAMQAQEEQARKQMEMADALSQREARAKYLSELIRANPAHAKEIIAANADAFQGVQYDPTAFTPTPDERFAGMVTQDAITNYPSLPQSVRQAGTYQKGFGAALPKELVDMIAANDVYANKGSFPTEMQDRQLIADKVRPTGYEQGQLTEANRHNVVGEGFEGRKTGAQVGLWGAQTGEARARTGLIGAQTGLVGEQTTNTRAQRDPNSPVSPGFLARNKPQGGARGGAPKPSSSAEKRAMGFYMRAKEAVDNLEKPYTDGGKPLHEVVGTKSMPKQWFLGAAPNIIQPEENQLYTQAQRQFTEARLRKDSGAAIPEHEFESDRRTYFAQPGDTPAVIERKHRERQNILDALKQEAGRAFTEYMGTEDEDAAPKVGDTKNGFVFDGQGWTKP